MRSRMNLSSKCRSSIGPRASRIMRPALAIAFGSAGLFFLPVATGIAGSSRGSEITEAKAAGPTFVTAYSNILKQVKYGLTPESVGATNDGGYVALALTDSPTGVTANWLLKLDGSGRPQWQKELECTNGAPGDYALGLSTQQLSDGGYVIGGGILGCGGSYIQHALVEKIDPQGQVVWAFAYPAGSNGSTINQIRQTSDGGYIAVGIVSGSDLQLGALILKLDG